MFKQILKKTSLLLAALTAVLATYSTYVFADDYVYCYHSGCIDVCTGQGACMMRDGQGNLYWTYFTGYDPVCC